MRVLDHVLPVRVPSAVAEAVREAAEREGSTVAIVMRELLTGYAMDAGTLAEPPRRAVRREKVA